jgi:hypothetical protein
MLVKDLVQALLKSHQDAEVLFCVNLEQKKNGEIEDKVMTVEHNVMWRRERGDLTHPGFVYLGNDKSQFSTDDGTIPTEDFFLT